LRYARDRAQDAEGVARLAHAERDFLDRHVLNWLPLAQAKLADAECGPFGPLATLLTRFARFERSALEVATAHVPGAERPLSHAVSLRS